MATEWVAHTVETASTLGAWSVEANLYCDDLTIGCAPTLDQASLSYNYGTINETYRGPLDLEGKFIRIRAGAGNEIDWVGYVVQEQRVRGPEETATGPVQRERIGDQTFRVVGLEWFLMTTTINRSYVYPATTIDRALGFNAGLGGDGRDVNYADRGNKDDAGQLFAQDEQSRELWYADGIVTYLLANNGPQDIDENLEPCEFQLATLAASFLSWYAPTVFTAGRSLWQVLNDIIAPHRGLVWWVTYDDVAGVAEINVNSMATGNITLPGGGGTLPLADNQTAIDPNEDEDAVRVNFRYDRQYGLIVCRGALRRSVFTIGIEDGTLEPSWPSSEETAYLDGVSNDATNHAGYAGYSTPVKSQFNDRLREAEQFTRVYQAFHIPATWNGLAGDGASGNNTNRANPIFEQTTGSAVANAPLTVPAMRLQRVLPIKAGYDYADPSNPTSRDPTNTAPDWAYPFAVIKTDGTNWRFAHKINTQEETDQTERLTSYRLQVLSGTPGIRIEGQRLPHTIAKNHFDTGSPEPSLYTPEVDYDDMRVTVCGEWDSYCEGQWPAPGAEPADNPLQTLFVNIGDRARFDYMCNGTVYDCVDGRLLTTNLAAPDDGKLRDDTPLCIDVARIAFEWYSTDRAAVEWAIGKLDYTLQPGDLITTVGTGAAQHTVNATVSQIQYRLVNGQTKYLAGFEELDFAGLANG